MKNGEARWLYTAKWIKSGARWSTQQSRQTTVRQPRNMELRSVTSKDGGSKKTIWETLTVKEKLIVILKVKFGYQSVFLKISLEKRGRLIIRVVLYSGQYGIHQGLVGQMLSGLHCSWFFLYVTSAVTQYILCVIYSCVHGGFFSHLRDIPQGQLPSQSFSGLPNETSWNTPIRFCPFECTQGSRLVSHTSPNCLETLC